MNYRNITSMKPKKMNETSDLVLMNFKIPRKMKKRFKEFLEERNMNQTAFLRSSIRTALEESEYNK